MGAVSTKVLAENFKNSKRLRLEGEVARRVQKVRRIVEEKDRKLSREERRELCRYIADATREWKNAYYVICDNLEFVVDRALTQREVWYKFLTVAPPDVHEFLEKKAETLKKGWAECYARIVYYFLLVLEAAELGDMKEERPVEVLIAPGYGEMSVRKFERSVRGLGKSVEEVLRGFKFVMYVEKLHIARRIASIITSLNGAVVAGKGFPTRYLRLLMREGKLLILSDSDKSGSDIFNVFQYGAKRHIKIGGRLFATKYTVKNTIKIGLTREDAIKLGLPPIPETKRARRLGYEQRYELDALAALEAKGIEDPYVAYVLAKLKIMGFDLKIKLPPDDEVLAEKIDVIVERGIRPIISEVATRVAKEIVRKVRNVKADDFTVKREILEVAVQQAVQEFKKAVLGKEVKTEIWDMDTKIELVPSEISTLKEYEEYLLRSTGADKIMLMLGDGSC